MTSTTTEQNNQDTVLDTNTEFSLQTIEKLGKRVRVTDSDESTGLQLYCYLTCSPDDDDDIKQCRGVVLHGPDVVLKGFPYAPEYTEYDTENLTKYVEPILSGSVVFDAHEGALIRMFFFMDVWYVSTHRKLDAFKSKWSSKESFGTLFRLAITEEYETNKELSDRMPENDKNVIERFQSTLDTDKQYMFLVRNNSENRIVSQPPKRPTVYHVGTFVGGSLRTDIDCGVRKPLSHTFSKLDDLRDYVHNIDYREKQGVIVFAPGNMQYKIVSREYKDFFDIRGNEPSIKFRYLQLRLFPEKVAMLDYLYPEMRPIFDRYEDAIYGIGSFIYDCYVRRYIHKEYVELPQQEFSVMKTCHASYIADRSNNKISIDRVMHVLNSQQPTSINQMIRRYIEGQRVENERMMELEKSTMLFNINEETVE